MFDRLRRSAAALCILILVFGTVLPSTGFASGYAGSETSTNGKTGTGTSGSMNSSGNAAFDFSVPIMTDALILRPLGLAALALGVAGAIAATPIVALTRPSDIAKPYRSWVLPPARYIWVDPLGKH